MADDRLELIGRAAANNAALCDAVCRSHGIAGRFDADAWVSPSRTPPRYPDAVTLAPVVDRDDLLARIDARVGCSIKDSDATLDLSSAPGWSVLFEATWVARPPTAAAPGIARAAGTRWEPVDDAVGLAEWADAWRSDGEPSTPWRPDVLDEDVIVLAGRTDGAGASAPVVSGAVVNVAADVVGVSNLFGPGSTSDAWTACLAWIAEHLPGRTIVGYESGDDLTAALDHGFEPVGPLRIWLRSP